MFNYLIYFSIEGVPAMTSACVKSNNPDDALHKLSETLYGGGANEYRLVTMQSVSQEYLFENESLIEMWI